MLARHCSACVRHRDRARRRAGWYNGTDELRVKHLERGLHAVEGNRTCPYETIATNSHGRTNLSPHRHKGCDDRLRRGEARIDGEDRAAGYMVVGTDAAYRCHAIKLAIRP